MKYRLLYDMPTVCMRPKPECFFKIHWLTMIVLDWFNKISNWADMSTLWEDGWKKCKKKQTNKQANKNKQTNKQKLNVTHSLSEYLWKMHLLSRRKIILAQWSTERIFQVFTFFLFEALNNKFEAYFHSSVFTPLRYPDSIDHHAARIV